MFKNENDPRFLVLISFSSLILTTAPPIEKNKNTQPCNDPKTNQWRRRRNAPFVSMICESMD